MAGKLSTVWQYPFVNLFKTFDVQKVGDVKVIMNREVKATVHSISGAILASNYILLPKPPKHSLQLKGRFIYFHIKPVPSKYFTVHLEAATEEGLVIRVSFSNLYKEFKSTSTWLRVPFHCKQNSSNTSWSLLAIDMQSTLATFVSRTYSYTKNVKVCGNVLVKGIFTSDLKYYHTSPEPDSYYPLPREMSLFVPKGSQFSDLYNFIQFPPASDTAQPTTSVMKLHYSNKALSSDNPEKPSKPFYLQHQPGHLDAQQGQVATLYPTAVEPTIPQVITVRSPTKKKTLKTGKENRGELQPIDVPINTAPPRVIITRHGEDMPKEEKPVLALTKIIGHGGSASCSLLFSASGVEVVYPSHSIIVAMNIKTKHQRFFMGHTNKVSGTALSGGLLASGESGPHPVVRIWDFEAEKCLALIKAHHSDLHWLQFSENGAVLLGVGKDAHGRNAVILWSTAAVVGGEVRVMAKAHTDVAIAKMKFAPFDHSRMVSCGWDNIRLWRTKEGVLKSCPVDLGSHHQVDFTDVTFQAGMYGETTPGEKCILASTSSGLVFEVHYQSVSIRRIWKLSQEEPPSGVTSLVVHEAFCVTGGEDGLLRVWPLDFSSVLLEAHHDSPIAAIMVSRDGLSIVASTEAGSVGLLDAATKVYSTLAQSHTGCITDGAVSSSEDHLVTVSDDKSVRVWDIASGSQTHQFLVAEDCPSAVTCHPLLDTVACGFCSGSLRIFSLRSASLLADHKCLGDRISHVAYSKASSVLFVSTVSGSLALFNGAEEDHALINVYSKLLTTSSTLQPFALSDECSRLAVIGPHPTTVTVFDLEDMQEVLRMDTNNMEHHSRPLEALVGVSFPPPSYTNILVQTSHNSLLLFDLISGRMTREILGWEENACTTAILFTDSGEHALTGSGKMVKVWRTRSGRPTHPQVFLGHCGPIRKLLLAKDNSTVISLAESVLIWSFHGNKKGEGFSCVSPPRAAPAPVEYVKPMPSMVAPTPLHPLQKDEGTVTTSHTPTHSNDSGDGGVGDGGSDSENGDGDSENGDGDGDNGGGSQVDDDSERGETDLTGTTANELSSSHLSSVNPSEGTPSQQSEDPPSKPVNCEGIESMMHLERMTGIDTAVRHNLAWHPLLGYIVYSCGNVLVLEDLSSSKQCFLTGHSGRVTALALQHSGDVLASYSSSCREERRCGEIRLWSPKAGESVGVLRDHCSEVVSMDYSRDDRFLVSVGSSVSVWSTVDYRLVSTHEPELGGVCQVKWNPYLANTFSTVGAGPHVAFWKLIEDTSKQHLLVVSRGNVPSDLKLHNQKPITFTSLAFDSSSKLYVATSTGDVVIWNWSSQKCLYHWKCSSGEISVIFSKSGRVISGGCDGTLSVWTAEQNTECFGMRAVSGGVVQIGGAVTAGCFDDNLQMGVVGNSLGSLYYVNWNEPSAVRLVTGPSSEVVSMATSDGILATACADGTLFLWSVPSLELHQMYHTPNMKCLSVGLLGCRYAAVGYSKGCVRVFDIKRNRQSSKMSPHGSPVTAVEFSSSGDTVLSGAESGVVAVNDRKSGICMFVISDHAEIPISMLQCSQHMIHLASCGSQPVNLWIVSGKDGRHSVWGSRWVENIHALVDWITLPNTKGSIARISPVDNDLILISYLDCQSTGVYFYSLSHHKVLETCELTISLITSLALSPSGKKFIAGGQGVLKVVNWENGQSNTISTVEGNVSNVCYFNSNTAVSSTSSFLSLWTSSA